MTAMRAQHLKDYRPSPFSITHIELDINLAGSATQVIATSKVVRQQADQTQLLLDGEALNLLSVTVDGSEAEYKQLEAGLEIFVDKDECELTIVTQLDPEANSTLEGLYMSDGAYCTQCEAQGFRRITYFLDRPDNLAIYNVRIEADKTAFPYLLSNGNLVQQGECADNRHFARWSDPFPKPSYLFALVAGDFDCLEDHFITMNQRKIKLQVFVDKGNLHKANHALASLKRAMAWDEQRFGLEYDLDIYMIVAVDFFNMGAMENKGLNLFNTKYVLADTSSATDDDYHGIESVVGHEYFHNWTGNRVTCRDWFQLSLKEGLTVFRDQEFSSDLGARAVNRIQAIKVIKNQQFAEDSGPMSHPIRPESVIEMNNFYTVTVYNKGAEVIRMMHTLLGEQNFQAGMKLYFERHDGQAVTCDDFVAAMADASGIDLIQFKRWYSQSGTPVVSVEEHYCDKTQCYKLTLSQHTPATADQSDKLPLHIPVDIELISAQGDSLHHSVLDLKLAKQEYSFDNIAQRPTVSLLQGFSAPVKLDFDYSVAQLALLMSYANNDVARWEASVNLFSQAVWHNVQRIANNEAMALDTRVIDSFKAILLSETLDPRLISEIFSFPSLNSLIEQVDSLDIEQLAIARAFVCEQLALGCEDELLSRYREQLHQDSAPARALKNSCLLHLQQIDEDYIQLAQEQYCSSDNMTDCLGALVALNQQVTEQRELLLTDFEQKWLQTPLVMDKWFTLQATVDSEQVLEKVKQLMKHEAFSLSNPNRVRSLIGSFAAANPQYFHHVEGAGYQFLTDMIIELNGINPQIAARIITPLIQFGKFDQHRQELMKEQLKRLLALPDLSKDLFEKVSKAL